MYGPTCIFWANLTPFLLGFFARAGGPLFVLGGMKCVMLAAAALAFLAFVVVCTSPEPAEESATGSFKWSDVRNVLNTREWLYVALAYWTMGIWLGFMLLFLNMMLVDKYSLDPSGVAVLMIPMSLSSLIGSVWVGPRVLTHFGPRPIIKWTMLLAGISEILKTNFRESFDTFYLVYVCVMITVTMTIVSCHAPAMSTLLPRAAYKYGSPHVMGTISGAH
jgi:predicted MFS family arabinose efflux permease